MKSLSEPIARRANAEDKVTGRFWKGRFKCQLLVSEKSILAAMTYIDLNPVRADIAKGVSTSSYTSVKMRYVQIGKIPSSGRGRDTSALGTLTFGIGDYRSLMADLRREYRREASMTVMPKWAYR